MKTSQYSQQNGTVLVMALIFLIVLTLLGLSAMEGTVLETKLASNFQENNFAFRVTELGTLQSDLLIEGNTYSKMKTNQVDDVTALLNTSIPRDHGLSADTESSQYTYKGLFTPRTSARNAGGQLAFFEIRTTALSAAGTGQGSGRTTLRVGVTRWAPEQDGNFLRD
ncbi:MAG: pilus assembly PilX N-terminal domain-containing protein [Pseudomonadota bacterium]